MQGGGTRNMWVLPWHIVENLLTGRAGGDYHFTTWLIDSSGKPARPADGIIRMNAKRKLIGNAVPKPLGTLFGNKKTAAA